MFEASSDNKPKKEHYFWSYVRAMEDLKISRRTLARWIDDLDIHACEFEDHLKVFLTLPHMRVLREYGKVMKTRNHRLITRYRQALATENAAKLNRIRKEII